MNWLRRFRTISLEELEAVKSAECCRHTFVQPWIKCWTSCCIWTVDLSTRAVFKPFFFFVMKVANLKKKRRRPSCGTATGRIRTRCNFKASNAVLIRKRVNAGPFSYFQNQSRSEKSPKDKYEFPPFEPSRCIWSINTSGNWAFYLKFSTVYLRLPKRETYSEVAGKSSRSIDVLAVASSSGCLATVRHYIATS